MSAYYFESLAAQQRLAHHASKWIGTPFVPHANLIGAGVDCVNLCAQVYMACGFLPTFNPPPYTMDGGKHNSESQLTSWLDAHGGFARIENDAAALPGDLLCFQTGRSAHHTGLVLNGPHFLHCLFARSVQLATRADKTFSRRLVAVYRPLK